MSSLKPYSHSNLESRFKELSAFTEVVLNSLIHKRGMTYSEEEVLVLMLSKLEDLTDLYGQLENDSQASENEFKGLYSELPPLGQRIVSDLTLAYASGSKENIKKTKKLLREYKKFQKFKAKKNRKGGAE